MTFSGCRKAEPEVTVLLNSENQTGEEQESEETGEADPSEEPSEADSSVEEDPENSANTEPEDSDPEVCVYICGCVKNPGVYHLTQDARICDAVDAAGGMTQDAAENYWNLAEHLTDGDMIYIPSKEEAQEREEEQGSAKTSSLNAAAQENRSNGQAVSVSAENASQENFAGKVNINTADSTALMTLPGIGETRAAAIIAYRNEHGYFSAISDIKNVSGIGDALFENMKSMITVDE